jgi:FMN reductase [NAD(P)H]
VDFRELLTRRRMVRHFAAEPVDRETLSRIVDTVRRAPSAGYSQGQRLVVVTDHATKKRLAGIAGEEESVREGSEPWFTSAAAHVFVCTREQDYHDRYRSEDKLRDGEEIPWPVPYWHVDAGAALMLVLLAAIDEGLAAGVYGVQVDDQAAVRELLGIPDDVSVVAGITIGVPADDSGWSSRASRRTRPRKPLEELVRWERWS